MAGALVRPLDRFGDFVGFVARDSRAYQDKNREKRDDGASHRALLRSAILHPEIEASTNGDEGLGRDRPDLFFPRMRTRIRRSV
jgi:hypothetical protein